jgi:hypothetical protein
MRRQALRIGAVGAIVGGVIGLVANLLHPREAGSLDDVEGLLEEVSGSSIWVGDHFAILVALALLLAAFYGLTESITSESGAAWAQFAWGAGIVGIATGLPLLLVDGVALSQVADLWAEQASDAVVAAASAVALISFALFTGVMLFLFGAVPILYGVAMLHGTDYAPWLGWVGVIFGLLSLVSGVIQVFAGIAPLTAYVLFPIGSVVVTLWIIYLGVLMWRKSAALAAPAQSVTR